MSVVEEVVDDDKYHSDISRERKSNDDLPGSQQRHDQSGDFDA